MIRKSCYYRWGEGYTPPHPEEVREILQRHDLTGDAAAALVGASGSRVVRRWTARRDGAAWRQIPYAYWRLLLLEVEPEQTLAAIDLAALDGPPDPEADPEFYTCEFYTCE